MSSLGQRLTLDSHLIKVCVHYAGGRGSEPAVGLEVTFHIKRPDRWREEGMRQSSLS